jgi:hypothetical protein
MDNLVSHSSRFCSTVSPMCQLLLVPPKLIIIKIPKYVHPRPRSLQPILVVGRTGSVNTLSRVLRIQIKFIYKTIIIMPEH